VIGNENGRKKPQPEMQAELQKAGGPRGCANQSRQSVRINQHCVCKREQKEWQRGKMQENRRGAENCVCVKVGAARHCRCVCSGVKNCRYNLNAWNCVRACCANGVNEPCVQNPVKRKPNVHVQQQWGKKGELNNASRSNRTAAEPVTEQNTL